MYVRPQSYRSDKTSSGIRLPDNYGGNAFNTQAPAPAKEELSPPRPDLPKNDIGSEEGLQGDAPLPAPVAKSGRSEESRVASRFRLGSLLGLSHGISGEELLIIALILLLSDSEGSDDLILFLLLLLFIK